MPSAEPWWQYKQVDMTLVIAQKINNQVSLSSDSRISFGSSGQIDFGIKVFSVPSKIRSPTSSETNISSLDYEYKLGMAVIGNAINAYTVKESIYEILQHLQYIPGRTDLSMAGISNLVFKVFNKTSLDLTTIIREIGICEIILAGYCPNHKNVRIFKFSVRVHPDRIEPYVEEILANDGIEFFGTGRDEASRVHTDNRQFSPLHIIREVIKRGTVNSVGGGLQYGEFVVNQFKVYGVTDYELNSDGTFKEYLYTLRGTSLYKGDFENTEDNFHIAYSFKMPFQQEIMKILK